MINRLPAFFKSDRAVQLLLFVCCLGIYVFYFHTLFLNLNSRLASLTSDTLKNYYTYIYHIQRDAGLLHFEGMNYPFGEHVVYTDCQPLITFILRLLPFTHNHLIGILHLLIFFSYAITPVILFRIFRLLALDRLTAFFAALAIALLSPQFWRLDGHFALTYECVIPIALYLLLKFFKTQQSRTLWLLVVYNCALFLIHPYLGLGLSLFSFFALLSAAFPLRNKQRLKRSIQAASAGLLPIVLFKLFLFFTDQHQDRTNEPFGIENSTANVASIFVANAGPFKPFMQKYISGGPQEFEGLAYMGLFTVCCLVIFLLTLPFLFRALRGQRELINLAVPAFLLMLFACGLHNLVLDSLGLHLAVFDQFRSLGRFAWFFYYMAPVFLITFFYHALKSRLTENKFRHVFTPLVLLFFALNLVEADAMFRVYSESCFRDRNIFRKEFLTAEETAVIRSAAQQKPQAILPLPLYYIGSEVYSRIGGGNSMLPSMIYSYHCATPIIGGSLSRTSISETEDAIELLNVYKKDRRGVALLNNQPFLVLKSNEELLPDEVRLLAKAQIQWRNDSAEVGYVQKEELLKPHLHPYLYHASAISKSNADSSQVIYIPFEEHKPFLPALMSSYETVFRLDSNILKTGRYIVSLHYHFTEKNYRGVYNHLILTKANAKEDIWESSRAIRVLSGFYKGFAVFEYAYGLEQGNKYEFIMKGHIDQSYSISDFMIRPDTTDVITVRGRDTLINNFPQRGGGF